MRLQSFCFNKIGKFLDFYSQFNPSPLSIKQFLDFGKLCREVEIFMTQFREVFRAYYTNIRRRTKCYVQEGTRAVST